MYNPGLCHLPERILGFLDRKTLLKCREVSQTWKQFIDDPNQKWRREWNRKLESALEAKVYFKRENSQGETLYEAWPHWKETCEYFQNVGPLPQMIIFTQSLVQNESTAIGLRKPSPYGFHLHLSSFCNNPFSFTHSDRAKFLKVLLSCPNIPKGQVSQ